MIKEKKIQCSKIQTKKKLEINKKIHKNTLFSFINPTKTYHIFNFTINTTNPVELKLFQGATVC